METRGSIDVTLPTLGLTDPQPLPAHDTWLLLGLKRDASVSRELAAAVSRLSVHADCALPVAVVSGLGAERTTALADDLELALPIYLDDGEAGILSHAAACPEAFMAMVRDGRMDAVACAGDRDALVAVARVAMQACGVEHVDPAAAFSLPPDRTY
jgi:hypothetical protein